MLGTNYQNTQVSFNVENINKITFGVGHIDDAGGANQELIIFKDGIEYYRLPLTTNDPVQYYTLNLSDANTLRFYISSQCRYGFVNIVINDDYSEYSSTYNDLSKVVDIGKLKNPSLLGDCNDDGSITIIDAVILKRHLLDISDLKNSVNADLNEDTKVNGLDLCLMKSMLLTSNS
jgi:hypothetical protein